MTAVLVALDVVLAVLILVVVDSAIRLRRQRRRRERELRRLYDDVACELKQPEPPTNLRVLDHRDWGFSEWRD